MFAGVGLFLNGRVLPNNSIVLLRDIGEGSSGLFCLTDRARCCSNTAGGERRGAWRFPNGSEVSSNGAIYRTRSYSSVVLNKRNTFMEATGVYICSVPDNRNVIWNLYLGLFNDLNEGEQFNNIFQQLIF